MPNRCFNSITISGKRETMLDIIEKIKAQADGDKPFFSVLLPTPKEKEENWYERRMANRGIKRDLCILETEEIIYDKGDRITIEFSADSPRGPPTIGLEKISEKYLLDIDISYDEPGMNFSGRMSFHNGSIENNEEYDDAYYGEGVKCKRCGYMYMERDLHNGICEDCENSIDETGDGS